MGSNLTAAAGKVDLDPRVGQWMTGFASRTGPAQGIHDPITARALMLRNDEASLVIVACDLLGFSADAVAAIRRSIEARAGINAGNILVACTHTHSGPASLPMRGSLGCIDREWFDSATERIVGLVSSLPGRLRPAVIAHASATVSGIGFNRQDSSRARDEELVAVSVETGTGETLATVINYATHAVVLGGGYTLYSADFPGEVNRRVEEMRGGVGLYLQGACGDINPAVELRGNFEDCERIGDALARAAVSALAGSPRVGKVELAAASRPVDVPVDPPPSLDQLESDIRGYENDRKSAEEARDIVKQHVADARLEWAAELRERMIKGSVPQTVRAEAFAAKVNDLRIVGLPFETYNDIGVEIKRVVKPLQGLFVGYANGLFGYCPTDWAKDQGGYGPEGSYYWFGGLLTPVGYGAAELLIRECSSLAKSL